mgnify:CR=1 FL=1
MFAAHTAAEVALRILLQTTLRVLPTEAASPLGGATVWDYQDSVVLESRNSHRLSFGHVHEPKACAYVLPQVEQYAGAISKGLQVQLPGVDMLQHLGCAR